MNSANYLLQTAELAGLVVGAVIAITYFLVHFSKGCGPECVERETRDSFPSRLRRYLESFEKIPGGGNSRQRRIYRRKIDRIGGSILGKRAERRGL